MGEGNVRQRRIGFLALVCLVFSSATWLTWRSGGIDQSPDVAAPLASEVPTTPWELEAMYPSPREADECARSIRSALRLVRDGVEPTGAIAELRHTLGRPPGRIAESVNAAGGGIHDSQLAFGTLHLLLAAEADSQCEAGDAAGAAEALCMMLQVTSTCGNSPHDALASKALFGYPRAAGALAALAGRTDLPAPSLAQIEAHLDRCDPLSVLALLVALRSVNENYMLGPNGRWISIEPDVFQRTYMVDRDTRELECAMLFDHARSGRVDAVVDWLEQTRHMHGVLTDLRTLAERAVAAVEWQGMMRLVCAIERHRSRRGAPPADLDELPAAPIDPFTRDRMAYARQGLGYAITCAAPREPLTITVER